VDRDDEDEEAAEAFVTLLSIAGVVRSSVIRVIGAPADCVLERARVGFRCLSGTTASLIPSVGRD